MHRFLRVALIGAAIFAITAVALSAMLPTSPDSSGDLASSQLPSSTRPATPLASDERRYDTGTVVGPDYDAQLVHGPTRSKSQSKLWFNDGSWWAVMADSEAGEFRIAVFDPANKAWLDTGTVIEPRISARMDVLWDGAKLIVVSAGSKPTARGDDARLYRFSYDAGIGRYFLDPDFPVSINTGGIGPITVARDSTGVLWAAYVVHGQVMYASSVGDDHVWNTPAQLPVDHTSVAADEAAVVTFGDRVGIMWSNQSEGAMYFAFHGDGEAPGTWSPAETAVEERAVADNHVSIRSLMTPDGPVVVAATKTSKDASPGEGPESPQVLLLMRRADGAWVRSMVARVTDHHTRPALVIEEDARRVHVFATSPFDGGQIFHKVAQLDDLVFEAGVGETFLTTEGTPLISNVSVPKQNVTAATGMVVMASDDSAGHYVSRAVSLGDAGFPEAGAVALNGETVVLNDTFVPFLPGALDPVWAVTAGSAAIGRGGDDNVLRLVGDADGSRTCRRFAPGGNAVIRATATVEIDSFGSARTTIIKLRTGGSEVLAIRAGPSGALDYASGAERIDAGAPISLGERVILTVTVDPASATYEANVVSATSGATLLDVAGVAVRNLDGPIDEVCFEASANSSPGGLGVDAVAVTRIE